MWQILVNFLGIQNVILKKRNFKIIKKRIRKTYLNKNLSIIIIHKNFNGIFIIFSKSSNVFTFLKALVGKSITKTYALQIDRDIYLNIIKHKDSLVEINLYKIKNELVFLKKIPIFY